MIKQSDRSASSFLISTVTDLSCLYNEWMHSGLISNQGMCRDQVSSGNRRCRRWDCNSISHMEDLHMIIIMI